MLNAVSDKIFQGWGPTLAGLSLLVLVVLAGMRLGRAYLRRRRGALAREGAPPGENGGAAGPGPCGDRRTLEISRAIVAGRKSGVVYRDIAQAAREETGAVFAAVMTSGGEGGRLEVTACAAAENPAQPVFAAPLTQASLEELCIGRPRQQGVFLFDPAELGPDGESLVPAACRDRTRAVAVAPVREGGVLQSAVVAGFGGRSLPSGAAEALAGHAHGAQLVAVLEEVSQRAQNRERELAVCREELDSVNRLKSNFLSVVSHELRTPLTSVKAYAETLLDNVETIERETARDFVRVMIEENDRVIRLVDNMLSFACMETGHLKVEKTACDLGAIIMDVIGALERRPSAGEVNIETRMPRAAVVVSADRELMRQLLHNLISNAIKFTPPKGSVTVILEQEASAVRIVVQDTGQGIPEDQLEKIFERFHQVDASDSREHGGSGLGLAICRNIVEWHDGHIWVENVKEAGARFVVMLPMKDIVVRQPATAGLIGSIRFERERYLTLLVEMLSEFLQARKASIMLLDPEQRVLRIVAAKGLDPEFVQNTRVEIGGRIAGRVFLEETTLHVFDIENHAAVGRSNNSAFYGTKSFISAPLRDGDEVIGVLNVSDHVENREFTDADGEILEALGEMLAAMIRKLEAYEKVSANFEKLKSAMKSILHIREMWGSRNVVNLTVIALAIGRRLSLDEKSLAALRLGMNLYDLGMMSIPRAIRVKKEELTGREREALREHPSLGYLLASPMGLSEQVMRMIRAHHENYDGSGYPEGLAREEIPIEARIINVVDSFRALITAGPYRRCFTIDEARSEIIRGSGTKFDPRVVGAFVKVLHELEATDDSCELVLGAVERELNRKRGQDREEAELVCAKEEQA